MFRPQMLDIFRLYINLAFSYKTDTAFVGFFYLWGKGVCLERRYRLCQWWVHLIRALSLAMFRMEFIILRVCS